MVESKGPESDGYALTLLRADGEPSVADARDLADPDADVDVVPAGERYELRAALGEGGMGEVNLCRDRLIGRDVALKAVLPKYARESEARSRFVREARVQGQLEHPAIVPVYDLGFDAEGRPFFTMKRVRGVTLESVLDAMQRGDETTTRVYTLHKLLAAFVQVCLAIDFAHERGVLHRDLKPSNVMLGAYGEVYVLDWGLAKVRGASRNLESARAIEVAAESHDSSRKLVAAKSAPTVAGAVLGTPGYMAPEQIMGTELDARTDVYALGGILFELLTLEPLHGIGSIAGMMKRALDGIDARPSRRAPHRAVAPELEVVCERACARQPGDRYPTARALADAVEAYLSGDRDVELRKALAKRHLESARNAAERAQAPNAPADARTDALQEIGRAVALDPSNDAVLELLVTMLTQPPKEPPAEVLEAVETARLESQRRMLPRVAFLYLLAWLVFLPGPAFLGILDGKLMALPIAAWTVAAASLLLAYRYFQSVQALLPYIIVPASIALAVSSVIFGPLLFLPTLIVMVTMGTILVSRPSRRVFLVVCNALALLVPTVMAWLDVHPVSHVVTGDRTFSIGLAAFAVSRNGAFAVLTAANLAFLFICARFTSQYRDALTAAETKNQLQAWQLRHLVPAEASRALAPR